MLEAWPILLAGACPVSSLQQGENCSRGCTRQLLIIPPSYEEPYKQMQMELQFSTPLCPAGTQVCHYKWKSIIVLLGAVGTSNCTMLHFVLASLTKARLIPAVAASSCGLHMTMTLHA